MYNKTQKYICIDQCITHSKLNVVNLEKISNGMYLCPDIGVQHVLREWLLSNALHLMLDMCIKAAKSAFHTDS